MPCELELKGQREVHQAFQGNGASVIGRFNGRVKLACVYLGGGGGKRAHTEDDKGGKGPNHGGPCMPRHRIITVTRGPLLFRRL